MIHKKAELHIHLEGSLEPEMMLKLAHKNNVQLKYNTIKEVKSAYKFNKLQEFLDLYFHGITVLQTQQDFFDLTYAYLTKAFHDNITFCEMFVDPQAHSSRGVKLSDVFNGIYNASIQAKKDFGITANLIVCFLRHLSEYDALVTFEQMIEFKDKFIGIGLDSTEIGNPPHKFKHLFDTARKENLKLVAHAGEEGDASYVWEAIDILGVHRIDHGNAIHSDDALINRIVQDKIPLTMCPLSNYCLKVTPDLRQHQALNLLNQGVLVTINSDDPAYFGGYLNQNYAVLAKALSLSNSDLQQLSQNSLSAKFI